MDIGGRTTDLVGYRRWGHNEGDEPQFTQPLMYKTIRTHPTAREALAKRLVGEGVVTQEEADAALKRVTDELASVLESLSSDGAHGAHPDDHSPNGRHPEAPGTAVDAARLRELNEALLRLPDGFAPNARLDKNVLQKRREALDAAEPAIDWGHAETLAFAALLAAMPHDADLFRAFLESRCCLTTIAGTLARPGVAERAAEVAQGPARPPFPAPARERLLELVA